MWYVVWLTTALLALAHAHFLLNYPPSIGFSNDNETIAPCGGYDVIFNNITTPSVNLTVNGFTIELLCTDPQANWLLRATLGRSAPFNWTDLLPVMSETGSGEFCVPDLALPVEFVGQAGVVQVVQDVMGVFTYQCASVNFEFGVNATHSPACTDQTGLTVTLANSTSIECDLGNHASTIPTSTSSLGIKASATPSTSASANETPSLQSQAERVTIPCLGLVVVCLAVAAFL